jgi:hypothetical protein
MTVQVMKKMGNIGAGILPADRMIPMGKRAMNPKTRRILMQSLLVLVFAAAVGLAALVTHHVRMSMRVELDGGKTIGRLIVKLPAKWVTSPVVVEKGDGIESEEPPGELTSGRRLKIMRQRTDGLISPLEHLVRSGQIKADVLKALADGHEGFSLTNLPVAGWPGQMLTMTASPHAGVLNKDVVACAILPGSQAVVVQLEGVGPLDASDKELVRQISENVSLAMHAPAGDAGGVVELVDDIKVTAPSRYVVTPNDDINQLQRQLLFDGSWGAGWVAVDLVSCVFFADDKDEAFLAMLAARDPDWRSGPVKHLSSRTLMAERVDSLGQSFPSRAYLTANSNGRALLVVMRGGPRDQKMFDSAWQSISSSVKFSANKDLSGLVVNGVEAARGISERLLSELKKEAATQSWFMWDSSENADQELWSKISWQVEKDAISGTRSALPVDPYTTDTQFSQQWSAAADLSTYQVATNREVRRPGNQFPRQTLEQRVNVERGRLVLSSYGGTSAMDVALPADYVPGAILPLVLRGLADKPALVKTESFVGVDTLAPPGLLTLFITRLTDAPTRLDENGEPMDCVTVSVNGTGVVSRFYFSAEDGLRFIDFAGGLKAQSGTTK